jgi:Fic family protein
MVTVIDKRLGSSSKITAFGEAAAANVPPPLPPFPALDMARLFEPLGRADRALGRLDGISSLLPDPGLFIYMFVRQEAVLSSQIEGTQSTLTDLLRFETEAISAQPLEDLRQVSNYVDAMLYGLERLKTLPLSLRLLREIHARLLENVRGGQADPGEFRKTQNWIGGRSPATAVYVPPPVAAMQRCLDDLEKFMHRDTPDIPLLVKAGLLHVQFESIHPFLDGNGRLGRLLITLFLCVSGALQQPLLYLSLFFQVNRTDYYRLLQTVRTTGDWESWLAFFLEGIAITAEHAFDTARKIVDLFHTHAEAVTRLDRPGSALRLHEVLHSHPFISAPQAVKLSGLTLPTIGKAIGQLAELGILTEITGRARNRVYAYTAYLDLLKAGATLTPRSSRPAARTLPAALPAGSGWSEPASAPAAPPAAGAPAGDPASSGSAG